MTTGMTTRERDIIVLTKMREQAQTSADMADREWREAIATACREGMATSYIAEAAGISRARVYQIRDGKR